MQSAWLGRLVWGTGCRNPQPLRLSSIGGGRGGPVASPLWWWTPHTLQLAWTWGVPERNAVTSATLRVTLSTLAPRNFQTRRSQLPTGRHDDVRLAVPRLEGHKELVNSSLVDRCGHFSNDQLKSEVPASSHGLSVTSPMVDATLESLRTILLESLQTVIPCEACWCDVLRMTGDNKIRKKLFPQGVLLFNDRTIWRKKYLQLNQRFCWK